jgi:SAM-dependent methyltransferase
MVWLAITGLIIIGCFSFVLLFGAPYLPTLSPQVEVALDLLDLAEGQTMLELGCGDGKVLIAAAKRGWLAVGYELNPLLALIAWLRTRRYRGQVRVVCGNFWRVSWPPADGIYGFILTKFMARLDKKVIQLKHKPVKVASFAFGIPGKQPIAMRQGIFLYLYD